MITYNAVTTDDEILQIIELQKRNLPQNLTKEQREKEGFVTVVHTFDTLQKMNTIEPGIVAKDNDKVVGYLLAMTSKSSNDIPVLIPMFKAFDNVMYDHKKISNYKYLVVGQVCIAEGYRGQGILDACYQEYKNYFMNKYDFAITEIDMDNQRSINAHKRVGFKTVHKYIDPKNAEWNVVLWDWRTIGTK